MSKVDIGELKNIAKGNVDLAEQLVLVLHMQVNRVDFGDYTAIIVIDAQGNQQELLVPNNCLKQFAKSVEEHIDE